MAKKSSAQAECEIHPGHNLHHCNNILLWFVAFCFMGIPNFSLSLNFLSIFDFEPKTMLMLFLNLSDFDY